MVYRVSRKELEKGIKIEAREHPKLSERNVRYVARSHIEKYGPGYYEAEPVTERIVEAKTKALGAKPMRKRTVREYDPMTDGLPRHITRPPF